MSRIEVAVDPRTVLLEIVHLMAKPQDPSLLSVKTNGLAYSRRALKHFSPFRGHRALRAYREAFGAGLDLSLALQLSVLALERDGRDLRVAPDFWSPWRIDNPGGHKILHEFLEQLRGFAREARFDEFFDKSRSDYESFQSSLVAEMALEDPVELLEEYTGLKVKARYTIYLCPLLEWVTSHVEHRGAGWVLTFLGPEKIAGGRPDFAYRARFPVVWHELGHTLLDSLASARASRGDAREYAAQGLANALLKWAQARRRALKGRPIKSSRLTRLDAVTKRFQEFEKGRDRYPTIKEFYPRLREVLI